MPSLDTLDVLALIGLALLALGLAGIWWPLAPLVVGALILAGVVYRATRPNTEAYHGNPDQPGGA